MLAEVKKCADNGDITGLRYIFADCLDVDPTFEKYRAEYEFCKSIDGMFERYEELNGIILDENRWDLQYWVQLKLDLKKNFSQKRFEHMIKVAQIIYVDKIERLLAEREAKNVASTEQKREKSVPKAVQSAKMAYSSAKEVTPVVNVPKRMTESELQEKRLEEKRKVIELENQKIEAKQKAQRARIEAEKRKNGVQSVSQTGGVASKKLVGIVLVIIAVVIVGIAMAFLR